MAKHILLSLPVYYASAKICTEKCVMANCCIGRIGADVHTS